MIVSGLTRGHEGLARRRRMRAANRLIWEASEWERAWEVALMRIDGAPAMVASHIVFKDALDMLNSGFAKGDAFQFQLGILMIMDACNEAIKRGDCEQWW